MDAESTRVCQTPRASAVFRSRSDPFACPRSSVRPSGLKADAVTLSARRSVSPDATSTRAVRRASGWKSKPVGSPVVAMSRRPSGPSRTDAAPAARRSVRSGVPVCVSMTVTPSGVPAAIQRPSAEAAATRPPGMRSRSAGCARSHTSIAPRSSAVATWRPERDAWIRLTAPLAGMRARSRPSSAFQTRTRLAFAVMTSCPPGVRVW